MPLLEIHNLHTYFKTKKGIVKAVNDVSYSVERVGPWVLWESPEAERAFLP